MVWPLIIAAVSAAVQAYTAKEGIEAQSAADAQNIREQYAAQAEQERQAQAQAAEQMTDRMRQAHRQLSLARVLQAEGAGGLRGRAENILASANEDVSRLTVSRDGAVAAIRGDQNAARVAHEGRSAVLKQEGRNNTVRFISNLAAAGASAYGSSAAKAADVKAAQGMTGDYTDPNRYKFFGAKLGASGSSIRF